jgi:hypothetical protein
MSDHSDHRTAIMPDIETHEYRPWCHDCREFFPWKGSEYDKDD